LDTYIKSPLLIAGLYADGETTVIEEVKSRDHSELMLNYFGADIKVNGLEVTSGGLRTCMLSIFRCPEIFQ